MFVTRFPIIDLLELLASLQLYKHYIFLLARGYNSESLRSIILERYDDIHEMTGKDILFVVSAADSNQTIANPVTEFNNRFESTAALIGLERLDKQIKHLKWVHQSYPRSYCPLCLARAEFAIRGWDYLSEHEEFDSHQFFRDFLKMIEDAGLHQRLMERTSTDLDADSVQSGVTRQTSSLLEVLEIKESELPCLAVYDETVSENAILHLEAEITESEFMQVIASLADAQREAAETDSSKNSLINFCEQMESGRRRTLRIKEISRRASGLFDALVKLDEFVGILRKLIGH